MNLKKAKALRRIAQEVNRNAPLVEYEPMKPVRIFDKKDVAHIGRSAIFLGQKKLKQGCQRYTYQGMKKYAEKKSLPLEVLRKAA